MVGEMFFVHQKLVRCAVVENGWAKLQYIDSDGIVRISSAPVSALRPARDFLSPHTWWPEGGNLSEVEAEREERAARAERLARKKAARKARRSMKLSRGER